MPPASIHPDAWPRTSRQTPAQTATSRPGIEGCGIAPQSLNDGIHDCPHPRHVARITFSFLIAAPMINEVALGLLFALLGWKVALTYLAFGLTIAIVSGWIIGRLHLEGWLEEWVRNIRAGDVDLQPDELTWIDRFKAGWDAVKEIVGKVWYWIIAGIAVGAFIHGYVPAELLSRIMGADAWWSVPAAVLLGVPMYSNAAGIIPVVEALLGKGAALGTVLAFMMSVIALSLPEMIILRKVLSVKLIAVFVAVVASGILAVGFLFNLLFS